MKNKFMNEAINLAIDNVQKNHGGPFGAVVVLDGKIIGRGCNKVTSINDPTAHAEIMAIRDACKNTGNFSLEGAEIYTSCEPCSMCLSAIYWARIKKIYYVDTRSDAAEIGFDDSYIYDQIALSPDKRDVSMERVLVDKPLVAFSIWKSSFDKVKY